MFRRIFYATSALACAMLVATLAPQPAFADDVRDEQWYLGALAVDKAHRLSQGEGVTIGLIDGGVDASHPDLKGNIEAGKDFGDSTGKGLKDADGHGTSMASLLVGHGHGKNQSEGIAGIAPKAKILSAGLHCEELCDGGTLISDAIKWLVEQKVDVISISQGAAGDDNKAIDLAVKSGVAVVAAAGNTTLVDDEILGKVEPLKGAAWPAMASGVIPVSGTDANEDFWHDSQTLKGAAVQPQLGISAPAENIVTAEKGGGYATHSGTSGSAPIVAGTLALIKSAYPDLTYFQWVDRLLDTTDDKGPEGFDEKFGAGIVNPYKALTEETTYNGKDGAQVSSPDDRLPLEGQGKGSDDSGNDDDKDPGSDEGSLTPSSSGSLLIPLGIVAAVVVLAVATVVIVVAKRHRTKSQPPPTPRL